ncbi:MAG TPA: ABC transporter substrate-binding protein [Candidatus Polarisedimenticolia bacterium]|jgi:peptide/nickel transport system substrate-binding protein|nr:ABC transporter substrate-binding protein [Candidatus Polarisedimenticolia bacterium]
MVSRREFLTIGTGGLAAASLTARAWAQAPAQTPKRGGTLSLRMWDPPHFDQILAHAYKTHVVISFTHSRLLKHKAGPGVRPGAFEIEGDLAESWQQTSDTTYVFKLKKGVRFHGKPPVNGRELTADDVRYTFERILTDKGSVNVSMYRSVAKVEAVDRYTVRFTLKEPFAWFLDMIANPMAGAIIAKECVEKFGDLKKPEAVIGTGPWMLDTYKPNVSITLVRNPTYFVAGLPHIERVEMFVDEDNASRMAAFLGGKYDLGYENPGTITRTDWLQIAESLKKRRPGLKIAEYPSNVMNTIDMRTDKPPFNDVRVRQAISLAMDRKGMIDAVLEGQGAINGPIPAALSEWALPIGELGEGAKYYRHDRAEAKRLLAAAGHPNGFSASVCFSTYGSTVLVDSMQLLLKDLKAVGIDAKLDQKEYGAYQATCRVGKFDSMVYGPLTPFVEPDSFLFGQYYTGEPRNRSHVNDPALDDLLVRQRRASDPKARRDVLNQIERHLAKQQYYIQAPSGTYIGVWDPAVKNYGPNISFDYGGRLVAAWLDR